LLSPLLKAAAWAANGASSSQANWLWSLVQGWQ